MKNENQSPALKGLSRKDFISITGKSVAAASVAGLVAGCTTQQNSVFNQAGASMQQPVEPTSPPARVPANPMEPIVLEKWKGEADPEAGPVPTPLAPNQRVGYAVVGLGHLSLKELLPALASCKKSKLTAIVSGSPEKLEKVGQQYDIPESSRYSYETYDEIKNNPAVDVIYIVLPNGLHHEFVIRGAEAGKHILCEKPMANTAAECRDMIAACENAGVKLMIAYRIHYQPHNRKLRSMLQNQEFGEAQFIDASNCQSSANPDHWRHHKELAGGGALPDIGLYCLNTNRFILGMEPVEVFGYMYSTPGNPLFEEVEEMMSWQMKFPNGIVANCSTHYDTHDSRYYRVLCKKGWMHIDNAYAYSGQEMKKGYAEGEIMYRDTMNIPANNQFGAEMDHFSDCIINDKTPFSTGYDGLQDHIIMEKIYESARSGKPVKIPQEVDLSKLHGPEPEMG